MQMDCYENGYTLKGAIYVKCFGVDCLQSNHSIQTPKFPLDSCPRDYH